MSVINNPHVKKGEKHEKWKVSIQFNH
jgi:hypothetical protein